MEVQKLVYILRSLNTPVQRLPRTRGHDAQKVKLVQQMEMPAILFESIDNDEKDAHSVSLEILLFPSVLHGLTLIETQYELLASWECNASIICIQ